MALRPLVAGNWKMNGTRASLTEIQAMARAYDEALRRRVELLICPPATLLYLAAVSAVGSPLSIGAQDCHEAASGAFTGSVSAQMLADCGARYVILGHSERRVHHHESDELVHAKALAAEGAGLTPIVCVGETLAERDAGRALDVLAAQIAGSAPPLDELVVAYEPVWAIGAGRTPSSRDIETAHALIRTQLDRKCPGLGERARILYGGSVKPGNAAEILATPHVNGLLVGGASLSAAEFMAIASACPA